MAVAMLSDVLAGDVSLEDFVGQGAPETPSEDAAAESLAVLEGEDGRAFLSGALAQLARAGVDPTDPHSALTEDGEEAVLSLLEALDDDLLAAVQDLGALTWESARALGEALGGDEDLGPALYWAALILNSEEE
jgi:hypothetical protein